MRGARASACASDYAASFGKVPLAIKELAGGAAGLAGLATSLGLDLDTLDLLQATVFGKGMGERFHGGGRRASYGPVVA